MKKKSFIATLALTLLFSTCILIALEKSSVESILFEANIDALSFDENSEYGDCFTFHTDAEDDDGTAVYVRICGTWSYKWVTKASLSAFCRK